MAPRDWSFIRDEPDWLEAFVEDPSLAIDLSDDLDRLARADARLPNADEKEAVRVLEDMEREEADRKLGINFRFESDRRVEALRLAIVKLTGHP